MNAADPDTFAAVSDLQQKLRAQEAELARLQALLAQKEAHWHAQRQSLFEQLRLLIDKRFGPSTEKYRVEQRDLFFDEAEVLVDAEDAAVSEETDSELTTSAPRKRRQRGGRAALPPELPRVEVIHDLVDDARQCPTDGAELKLIGEEVSEQLDIIPAQVRVIRNIRRKYACAACEEHVVTAPIPPQPLPKSNASPALLGYIALAKYQDALPLYRQEQIFKRLGLDLPRNTLARWMVQMSELLSPLTEAMRRQLLAGALIHMDETTVQVNTEPGRAASSNSYMWVSRGGPPGRQVVLFDYDASRSGEVPQRLLGDYGGILLSDGYEGYAPVVRQNRITHAGCWSHARRKFVEAQKVQPRGKAGKADWALSLIGKLYRVEQKARGLTATERQALRDAESRPLIRQLEQWLEKSLAQVPPKTAIGKALHYLQGQWPRLIRFLDDGRIPLDNNPAENAIRPFVVGRKNWLFSHTPRGAHASATLYSVIETAKANGLEPYAYLVDVLKSLPAAETDADLTELLPWNWGETIQA